MKEEISVLMSVYNSEKYLKECIDSVLSQTYSNFLFFIINDKSTDNSLNIISSYSDSRIRLIENDNNIGLTKSLNKGVDQINTKYIARIDADDICEPTRLSSQLDVLEGDENLALVGSSAFLIDETGNDVGEILVPTIDVKERLFFKNSFIHSTILVRTDVLKKYRYDEEIKYAQDYNLWVKISQAHDLTNLKERLIKYRYHDESVSVAKKKEQDIFVLPTLEYQLKVLGILNDLERAKFAELHFRYFILNVNTYTFREHLSLFFYFKKLLRLNRRKNMYNENFNATLMALLKKERGLLINSLKKFLFLK